MDKNGCVFLYFSLTIFFILFFIFKSEEGIFAQFQYNLYKIKDHAKKSHSILIEPFGKMDLWEKNLLVLSSGFRFLYLAWLEGRK